MFYTGIGSRSTPFEVMRTLKKTAEFLASYGFTLRSGGASGADEAFESGAGELKEIYLPWEGFNDNPSPLYGVCNRAMVMAEENHPAWRKLSQGGQKLMARNNYQILGKDLNSPSLFTIAWTPNGELKGGTAYNLKLGPQYGIPIFNLGRKEDEQRLLKFLKVIKSASVEEALEGL